MYNDFIVKVYRYWEDNNGSRGWDGWYYSKVYAIDGNEFLVYDNGDMSAYNGEEDFCETGFNWVDFTATMDRCGKNGRQPIVEPLVPFDIVEFMADLETENSSEKPNNCEHITEDGVTCAKYPACDDCPNNPLNKVKGSERLVKGSEKPNKSEIPTCSTISKMEQVETMSCQECKHWDVYKGCRERVCKYEPKDEPQTCSVNGRPYDCGNCEYHKCTADEPKTEVTTDCRQTEGSE